MKKFLVIISLFLINTVLAADKSTTGIRDRIAPLGQVNITHQETASSNTTASTPVKSGEEIYKSKCVVCHRVGLAGAPKLGDKAAWAPRLAKGDDNLLSNVTNGFNAMPPMGTCMDCSAADLKAAIDYMTATVKN